MTARTLMLAIAGIASALLTLPLAAAPATDCVADGPGRHGRMHDPARMQAFATRHLGRLHDQLKLTANQEAAWKTYADSITSQLAQFAKNPPPDRCTMQSLSTPERMEKMLEHSKAHEQALEQRVANTKAFYAQLTAEQQKVFDASHVRRPHGRGMGKGMGRGMCGGMGADAPPL